MIREPLRSIIPIAKSSNSCSKSQGKYFSQKNLGHHAADEVLSPTGSIIESNLIMIERPIEMDSKVLKLNQSINQNYGGIQ
jgi:hypothetical protein